MLAKGNFHHPDNINYHKKMFDLPCVGPMKTAVSQTNQAWVVIVPLGGESIVISQ